jgi:uncharacterized RDD family membrane protein YckC
MAASDVPAPYRKSPTREVVTPEGVALHVTLAGKGDRLIAVLIDLAFIGAILAVLVVATVILFFGTGSLWLGSVAMVLSFAIRSFYFTFFELRWQGMTPGKRIMKLRVMDRGGGRLRPNAVFARNLMREVELFMPMSLLFSATGSLTGFLTLLWTGVLTVLPLFNRDRLRAGDMVAGTWVVEMPKAQLLPDIAEADSESGNPASVRFSDEQLAIYGIFELQTLESVLRQSGPTATETRRTVAETIRNKIGWTAPEGETVDDFAFLRAFYAAQRNRLEHNALLGRRRADKFDKK